MRQFAIETAIVLSLMAATWCIAYYHQIGKLELF
jgi:hypothetical protein